MTSTLVLLSLVILATIAVISFLAGTSYNDYNRDQSYRRLAEQRRILNALSQQLAARSETEFGMTSDRWEDAKVPSLAARWPHQRTRNLRG